ncbi:MAG: transposase family protein, partial [Janthinobacterium lividum]
MPAPASCPITVPDDVLNGLLSTDNPTNSVDLDVLISTGPSLLEALREVLDPRDPRGVRHDFFVILALAICATLTGARGYSAIWRWSAQTLTFTRTALGITGPIPSEKTIRITLQNTDPDTLNAVVAAWLATWLNYLDQLHQPKPSTRHPTHTADRDMHSTTA